MGRGTGSRLRLSAVLALALCVAVGATGAADAKKHKKKAKAKPIDITKAVNTPIPDGTPTGEGIVASTIDAGAQFKGLRVRDVNATLTTTGDTPPAAADLTAMLIAPNGATSVFFLFGDLVGRNIGPLTYDDESPNETVGPTAFGPYDLASPYVGTVHPDGPPLSVMDDGPAMGRWTLVVRDPGVGDTSNFVSWRLQVTTGRPYRTR